jgi:hypothetical protein
LERLVTTTHLEMVSRTQLRPARARTEFAPMRAETPRSLRTDHTPWGEAEDRNVPAPMTRDEREAFLAAVHVGVLSADEPGRGAL